LAQIELNEQTCFTFNLDSWLLGAFDRTRASSEATDDCCQHGTPASHRSSFVAVRVLAHR
jgi:hypothetical protein